MLGVALAILLVPAALTGSVLVWKDSLDARLNPQLYFAGDHRATLSERQLGTLLRDRFPAVRIGWIEMPAAPGRSARISVGNWPRTDMQRQINEVFVDPATADILGVSSTVAPGLNRQEIIPWLYRFHYTLMLRRTGMLIMGAVAMAWLLDCVGHVADVSQVPVSLEQVAAGLARPNLAPGF